MDRNELSALTRVFSASVIRDLGRWGQSPLLARLLKSSGIAASAASDAPLGKVIDQAFDVLKAFGNRDEYVYRSAITQKILLGRHSLRTAAILNEVRVGPSRADVVVLNGTSTAYEIKSERDSLYRLASQLDNYRQVFATVNVVTSPKHASDVLRCVTEDVGVLVLSSRYRIQTLREATDSPERTSPVAVLELLRTPEAVTVLNALGVEVPRVPNTQMRGSLKEMFSSLDPVAVHREMVSTLRQSRSQSATEKLLSEVPKSLHAALLSAKLDQTAQSRVREATVVPLDVALAWS